MKNDWIKIKNHYIHHNITLEELAKKFKVSMSAITKHCSDGKWKSLKKNKMKEIEKKVEEKITEKEIDRKVRANEYHIELYDKVLKTADELLNMYMTELKDDDIKKKKLANAYNLEFVTRAITNAQKGQRLSLNIEKDETTNAEPDINLIKGIEMGDI